MAEKILVVDDEREIADLVALYLKNEGYETRVCYNGQEALGPVSYTHLALPGGENSEPLTVLYQTAEDGLGDTIKPRLLESQADLHHIYTIDETDFPLSMLAVSYTHLLRGPFKTDRAGR